MELGLGRRLLRLGLSRRKTLGLSMLVRDETNEKRGASASENTQPCLAFDLEKTLRRGIKDSWHRYS